MGNRPAIIVFRKSSPLESLYQPYRFATYGQCLAIHCRDVQDGLAGFVRFAPIHPTLPESKTHPAQVPISEILLIADELSPGQQPIGFLQAG